jgi:hypothetical protein
MIPAMAQKQQTFSQDSSTSVGILLSRQFCFCKYFIVCTLTFEKLFANSECGFHGKHLLYQHQIHLEHTLE